MVVVVLKEWQMKDETTTQWKERRRTRRGSLWREKGRKTKELEYAEKTNTPVNNNSEKVAKERNVCNSVVEQTVISLERGTIERRTFTR
jgi:hypothetical protein